MMNRYLLFSTLLGVFVSLVVGPPQAGQPGGVTLEDAKQLKARTHKEREQVASNPNHQASNGYFFEDQEKTLALKDMELAVADTVINFLSSKGAKRTV
ncbi:hypothetical protein DdX_15287 [Ditylenchus destructor]|uniref:Uncharacterized protein n=1 Tax=Ditylenchus destructor TaxID=166010 RepID=A0AAD4MVA9_9BILA|nr:hypothetical protein DdX_15287 [Ditylenchus destructor]